MLLEDKSTVFAPIVTNPMHHTNSTAMTDVRGGIYREWSNESRKIDRQTDGLAGRWTDRQKRAGKGGRTGGDTAKQTADGQTDGRTESERKRTI